MNGQARSPSVLRYTGLALCAVACGRIDFDPNGGAFRSRRIDVVAPVSGTLSGFPLLVRWGADPEVAAAVPAGLDQVSFTDGQGAVLPHEVERFDAASGAFT